MDKATRIVRARTIWFFSCYLRNSIASALKRLITMSASTARMNIFVSMAWAMK